MNILYIGDIMGQPGVNVVAKILPQLKIERKIDVVIAQGENVTEGRGMSIDDMQELQEYGIDFFTGGNHTPHRSELHELLEDPNSPVVGPVNMPACPGNGWKYLQTNAGRLLVVSLMGAKVGVPIEMTNPLASIERILDETRSDEKIATIVNFHGDYSSEKRVIGYYLDGRVSAVIGDHWHVPTADAMVLPNSTAHITDVGMCGSLHSSLGVKTEIIVSRWRDGRVNRNELETKGPMQFNAVIVKTNNKGLADSIEQIQKLIKA